jgi:hypothetical protein
MEEIGMGCRWQDDIWMDIKEVRTIVDCTQLAEDRVWWQQVVSPWKRALNRQLKWPETKRVETRTCMQQMVEYKLGHGRQQPTTMAARSKPWTVFAHSNTGVVGSSPTRGMGVCVCLFSACALLYALRRADPPSKESYRLWIGLRNWKSGHGPTKGCRATDE